MLEADSQGILAVPGHEWAVFRLGLPGSVTEVQVDTNHFKVSDSELSPHGTSCDLFFSLFREITRTAV